MERGFVTVKEAAYYLGIGKTKLYEMINAGEISVRRYGRAVRIPVDSLKSWDKGH